MAKYSYEFKKQIVDAYNNGEGSYSFLADKFGLSDTKSIREWVAKYNSFGNEGLLRSRKKETYSFKKKLYIVESYLSSEISYQDLALQEGITSPSMIANWVNRFRVDGTDALRPHKKGRKKTLNKPNDTNENKLIKETIVDTSEEHVKKLEDELLKLRIENAFLKELRRLRLEDEAKMREQHESSAASEDNSN